MILKLCEVIGITIILIVSPVVSNSINISSNKGHALDVSENVKELSDPPVPDISNHKNFNLLASTSDCGIYSIKKRIFNGKKTDLFEFPWMALLSYEEPDNTPSFKCAGTIINDRYILTAAHCIINSQRNRLLKVRVGEHNLTSDPDCETEGEKTSVCADPVQDIEIEDIIPHENFSSTRKTDNIGLLRLRTPIQFKRSVRPICLPIINEFKIQNFTNTQLIVTGWGDTSFDGGPSNDLLKGKVSVVSEKECKEVYKRNQRINIDHRYLCAGGPEGDACRGDSGGPLQGAKLINDDLQYVQFGITSFGMACGLAPGVYTRIDYYMDWILDNIKI